MIVRLQPRDRPCRDPHIAADWDRLVHVIDHFTNTQKLLSIIRRAIRARSRNPTIVETSMLPISFFALSPSSTGVLPFLTVINYPITLYEHPQFIDEFVIKVG